MATTLVIGAGPAGLTVATLLSRSGHDVCVVEASEHVGGMARSFRKWGRNLDVGPHRFFSNDPRINSFWLGLVGNEYHMVTRKTRIIYAGKFFDYPLNALNALLNLGLVTSSKALFAYLRAKRKPISPDNTFEAWTVNKFGKVLYEIFFQSYTEKLWGIRGSELDSDFARQRIKKFSLGEAIKGALSFGRPTRHRTLVDEFAYPNEGAGFPYLRMSQDIEQNGGTIILESRVVGIQRVNNKWTVSTDSGAEFQSDNLISSMPLTALVSLLDADPDTISAAAKLRFRNTIIVYLRLADADLFEDQWLYVQSDQLLTGRITNFNNWTGSQIHPFSDTVLALEYWCFDDDSIWHENNDALAKLALGEIRKSGLVSQKTELLDSHVIRVPKCYPVYDRGYREQLEIVQNFVDSQPGLTPIGRYGAFKYNNQDHSILMGILASENILGSSNHDLWGVNSDDEYQEGSRISETGLVMTVQDNKSLRPKMRRERGLDEKGAGLSSSRAK